jgi:hypothetical protein
MKDLNIEGTLGGWLAPEISSSADEDVEDDAGNLIFTIISISY